jgi:aminopeptidase N
MPGAKNVYVSVLIFTLLCLLVQCTVAQPFSRADSLRGSMNENRSWWNLTYYDLFVNFDIEKQEISGKNTIAYQVINEHHILQIDLQEPLVIDSVKQNGLILPYTKEGDAYQIELVEQQIMGMSNHLQVYYHGSPIKAKNPPWEGGVIWRTTAQGDPFIATACQGLGASSWWPCKDHMCDEPDSMRITLQCPSQYKAVSNGRLIKIEHRIDQITKYTWKVVNPINNYGVNANIAPYVKFGEFYPGKNGTLDCEYYVLPEHLDQAKEQFKQVPLMLKAMEYWFGPYPFYEDGYKLVEVPYLGMEHQSSVTYGNGFKNGYLGRDLSETGWGLKFDFIIIHESAHEWFANSITTKDIADMWVHESFATYAESLYLEYYYGKQAGEEYLIGMRKRIQNDRPIIGPYQVNKAGSGDMYAKGANMLHTLRHLVEDDSLWHFMLLEINEVFYHQTVSTQQVEVYLSSKLRKDLSAFFDQYLRTANPPVFEYMIKGKKLFFRWNDVVDFFDMPVLLQVGNDKEWVFPEKQWKSTRLKHKSASILVDPSFYVIQKRVKSF